MVSLCFQSCGCYPTKYFAQLSYNNSKHFQTSTTTFEAASNPSIADAELILLASEEISWTKLASQMHVHSS